MSHEATCDETKPGRHAPTWIHNSWAQVLMFLAVQLGALVWFMANVKDAQDSFRTSVDRLGLQVERMGEQIGRVADTNAHLDEHMKSVDHAIDKFDHRLEILEKEKNIEGWKR